MKCSNSTKVVPRFLWKPKARLIAIFLSCLAFAGPGNTATISYVETLRYFQLGSAIFSTGELTPDYQRTHTGADSFASQRTVFSPTLITVASTGRGGAELGMSVCYVSFDLAEPTDFQLSGRMALLGRGGFACVSLTDLLRPQEPLIFEVLPGVPSSGLPTEFVTGGLLSPGSYRVETIVYSGGTDGAGAGELFASFSVPEPSAFLLLLATSFLSVGCRQRCRVKSLP
jgi:hypothetical protein